VIRKSKGKGVYPLTCGTPIPFFKQIPGPLKNTPRERLNSFSIFKPEKPLKKNLKKGKHLGKKDRGHPFFPHKKNAPSKISPIAPHNNQKLHKRKNRIE